MRANGPARPECKHAALNVRAPRRYSVAQTSRQAAEGWGVDVARRSINDAAKVFLAAFVLGPPIGGIVFMALLQVVPWFAAGFAAPAPEVGANLLSRCR